MQVRTTQRAGSSHGHAARMAQSVTTAPTPGPALGQHRAMSTLKRLLRRGMHAGLLACALACAPSSGQAALQGMPLLHRFVAGDYPALPSHLAVVAARDGRIHLGNAEGLLTWDGARWSLMELPGRSAARALAVGQDGRLYIGGYDHFGVLDVAPDGARRYRDLRPAFALDAAQARVGNVWDIIDTPSGVYFRAATRLLFLGYDGRTAHWPLAPEVRGFTAVGDTLYARVQGVGLTRFDNGELRPEPGAAAFADRPLNALFNRADGRLLVSRDGFYHADAQGIRRLPGEAAQVFAEAEPYVAIELADGSLAIGTFNGEVLRFSADLDLISRHPVSSFSILDLASDREGGLWAATEGDAVRLRLPSPWSGFDAAAGLSGSIYDCEWHGDALWVATSGGVYRSRVVRGQVGFELAIPTRLEASDLEATDAGLLVSDREGVLWLAPGAQDAQRILTVESAGLQYRSAFNPDRLFVLSAEFLNVLRLREGRWQIEAQWPLEGVTVSSLDERAAGELWIGDWRGAPQRWRFDPASGALLERSVLGADVGLTIDPEHGSLLYALDGALYAMSDRRSHRWTGARFEPDTPEPVGRLGRPQEVQVAETPVGTFVYTSRELWLRAPGQRDWRALQLGGVQAAGFSNVHADADGLVRIPTWSGMLQFDPSVPEPPPPALAVEAVRIEVRGPGKRVERLPLAGPLTLQTDAALALQLALVSAEGTAEFRSRVRGDSLLWSDWSAQDSLGWRPPAPGPYTIEVQGRLRDGRVAQTLGIPVEVRPFWWQTGWARALMLFGAAALVVVVAQRIVARRSRAYEAERQRLEAKIAERTQALEEANRRLSEMATVDALTGVSNRRAMEQGLAREWRRCADLGRPIAALMIDVDYFKQYNDTHGHLAGDAQLRRVARLLQTQADPQRDLLARFGGEEFALILPGADRDAAGARARAIHALFDSPDAAVTVSIGVAARVPLGVDDPSTLVRAADAALYQSKRSGRNRIEFAD